jgi:hypothetical protein
MSVQDEHELRARLGTLLDGIEPRPAPVMRAVRRGRGIRMRRWISVAAGLAVIVAGAALIPGLLQAHRVAPIEQLHYKVTVTKLRARARDGVIAAGVTNGRHWQVRLSGAHSGPTVRASGLQMSTAVPSQPGWPASLEGGDGTSAYAIYGSVNDRVTRLDIWLPDGEVVNLTPVKWGGYGWVAVELPPNVRIERAVAYAGARELAYAVPYGAVNFPAWWRPGQVPARRVTKLIGSGRVNGIAWHYTAEIGPWGYCYTSASGSACYAAPASAQFVRPGLVISELSCDPLASGNTPASGLVAAASDVRRVVLRFSDGSTSTFPATEADGSWFVGYAIPAHLSVLRSVEYGAAGQVVGQTSGATWACPPS